jgi:hypothetical protein
MNDIEKLALVYATTVHSTAVLKATLDPSEDNENIAEIAEWVLDAAKHRIDRETAQTVAEQPNEGKGEKVSAEEVRQLVSDLRACGSNLGCDKCSRELRTGCAARLKWDAADMLEKLMEGRE